MKIVCFGDSNTYGFDPRLGSSGRYTKDERWTGILDAHDGFSVVNEGMNGRCIPDSDSGFASLASVLDQNPDADVFAILLCGQDAESLSKCSGTSGFYPEGGKAHADRLPGKTLGACGVL